MAHTPLRRRDRTVAFALLLALALTPVAGAFVAAGAQETHPDEAGAQLAVTDASIEGSGPWTSWLGAAPDRELVVTVVNIGTTTIEDPELLLQFGKGANPAEAVDAPPLGTLAPGASTSIRVELDLPVFAVGTYAVEGSFPDLAIPVGFRAETSHIPWLALVLPLLVLIQLGLVLVRNRVRDRIHRAPSTSDPTLPDHVPQLTVEPPTPPSVPEPGLEAVVREELEAVFDEAARGFDDSLDDAGFLALLTELATTVADRTEARIELTGSERAALRATIVDAVLDAFDIESVAI
ncbi:MAG: hypothetical protein R2707_19810 [Acidimicrobiales bacterium]